MGKLSFIKNWLNNSKQNDYRKSYSQCGEDLIIDHILSILDIEKPSYLDIGAHHPKRLNNTYFFYKKGCRGICVEPDPELFKEFSKSRKYDVCLNIGIGAKNSSEATFYVMTAKTLSTFSQAEAVNYTKSDSYGKQKIEREIKIPILDVNELFAKHTSTQVDFMSLDVEGLDTEIIRALNFSKYRPSILCIETIRFSNDRTMEKDHELISLLEQNGYMVYADTAINTIFINKEIWAKKYEEII